jgi:hypothetical protein
MLQLSETPVGNDVPALAKTRDAARRLVLELLGICVVLVAGARLPVHEVPGTSWAWLAPFTLLVAHMLLGLLVVVDGLRLVARSKALGGQAMTQAGAGLLVSVLAVVVGTISLAGRGPEEVRPEMVMAWVAGLAIYCRLWASSSAVLRAATRTTTVAAAEARHAESPYDKPLDTTRHEHPAAHA